MSSSSTSTAKPSQGWTHLPKTTATPIKPRNLHPNPNQPTHPLQIPHILIPILLYLKPLERRKCQRINKTLKKVLESDCFDEDFFRLGGKITIAPNSSGAIIQIKQKNQDKIKNDPSSSSYIPDPSSQPTSYKLHPIFSMSHQEAMSLFSSQIPRLELFKESPVWPPIQKLGYKQHQPQYQHQLNGKGFTDHGFSRHDRFVTLQDLLDNDHYMSAVYGRALDIEGIGFFRVFVLPKNGGGLQAYKVSKRVRA